MKAFEEERGERHIFDRVDEIRAASGDMVTISGKHYIAVDVNGEAHD